MKKRRISRAAAALLALAATGVAWAALPQGAKVDVLSGQDDETLLGAFAERQGLSVARAPVKVTVPIPPDAASARVTARVGKVDGDLAVNFQWTDRSVTKLTCKAVKDTAQWDGELKLPWNIAYHIRPDQRFYKPDQLTKVKREWEKMPPASEHLLTYEIRTGPDGAQLWMDGRLINELPQKGRLAQVEVALGDGGAIKEIAWGRQSSGGFLPLTIAALARPGVMAKAKLSISPGETEVGGIPMRVAPAESEVEVAGLGRLQCPSDDLVSFYWSRSAFDGLPEARMLTVPTQTYVCAHVLCAADEAADKVPGFTLRLTRYSNSRGGAMADTVARLSGPDARKVGTVAYGPDNARKTVPLWLVRVPLKTGLIQDVMREDESKYGFSSRLPTKRYLDFEILDPVAGVDDADAFPPVMKPTGRTYVPSGPLSSAHIFGITLETSPADLTVRPSTSVSAFQTADNAELRATVEARAPGKYAVAWDVADVDGRIAATGRREVALVTDKLSETVAVPVQVGNGWYAARFRLYDAAGRELVDHRSTFVVLPPDTRKIGFESPHGAWWFHWAHGGAPDLARVGTLYLRAGLRHANMPTQFDETMTASYKFTNWCVYWNGRKLINDSTVAEKVAAYDEYIGDMLKKWPSLRSMMIWHESSSGNAPVPSELWGEKASLVTGVEGDNWAKRIEYLTEIVKMVRQKYPQLKTEFGNCGDSCAIVGELMRRGFPKEYVDYVAVEDLGQTFIPERPLPGAMQSAWLLRQTARKLGCTDAKITACYEWVGRSARPLGLSAQAEWYARDALQARAYGFRSIALGTIHDAGKGYYHTIWGAGGLCDRYPYMYPKPAYAAMATLTRVLDGAVCERPLPTGSLSLFAVEFRKDGGWVYAFWTPRGKREAQLRFAADGDVVMTDLCGRETSRRARDLQIEAGTAAQYLTTIARIESVEPGKAWFPEDAPPEKAQVVEPLNDAARVELAAEPDKRLERASGWNLPHRKQGRFETRAVDDAEKGRCIELELKPDAPVSWELMHEYAYLKLKTPVVVAGPSEYVGLWVKGNSGWGDVMWEVENDKGKKWLTTGVYWDWQGKLAIDFDGWNLLRLQLNKDMQSNVKVTGLVVTMPRQALYVTEMAPVKDLRVRLKDVCLWATVVPAK